jgi:hypothetical protein
VVSTLLHYTTPIKSVRVRVRVRVMVRVRARVRVRMHTFNVAAQFNDGNSQAKG